MVMFESDKKLEPVEHLSRKISQTNLTSRMFVD